MKVNICGSIHEKYQIKNQNAYLELKNVNTGEKVRIICTGYVNVNSKFF